jgi:hypothetical protein
LKLHPVGKDDQVDRYCLCLGLGLRNVGYAACVAPSAGRHVPGDDAADL